ncbi:MAG: DUF1553 domain-containing protein [Planctomycetaceae bacterium]|nr:DUF1553 domain-containing protein [Planctomycetaceae bacterium]
MRLLPLLIHRLCVLTVALVWGFAAAAADDPAASGVQRAFFENRIRPVLAEHCFECHSAGARQIGGGLLLDSAAGLTGGGHSGPALLPGQPGDSRLIAAIKYADAEMPPSAPLSPAIVADFEKWVREGALYPAATTEQPAAARTWDEAAVWSFSPPNDPDTPIVRQQHWPRDPVDHFVLSRMEASGIAPVPDASPEVLIRRLCYDLTGLPPTVQQLAAFRTDCRTDRQTAIARLVDRLLASPQYGERWGRHWLDVARYGESNGDDGLGRNATFPYAWRYRDYVIDAFNADMPYDRFLTEQIAGDLLPADSADQKNRQLIATGFLAIGPKPAAAMNKDFPMDIVDNQIQAISTGVMGLSVACARCHDHKHDPIPMRDYYALAGIFTNTQTLYGDAGNEKLTAPPTPLHELVSEWPPQTIDAGQAGNTEQLTLPVGYHKAVQELGPEFHEPLTGPPTQLETTSTTFSRQRFAEVHDSCLRGRLDESGPDYTVSFWFRNQLPSDQRPITAYLFSRAEFGNRDLPGDHLGIGGTHESSRTGRLFVFNGNASRQSLGGTTVIRPGTWNHVTLTREADHITVFLNGNREIDGDLSATFGHSPDFCLAARSDRFAPLQGRLADFAVWDRSVSPQESGALFAASGRQRAQPGPGLAMGVRDKSKPADCRIHIGGTSGRLGPEVPRGFLTACHTTSFATASIDATGSGRRELAAWLTDPAHPQTARVIVNRVWQHLFGRGIVATPDDFGVYGARPSHPQLLDHLATHFVNDGWSIKRLIRRLVLTRTYQLDSCCDALLADSDPDNLLLARHTRRRLDAESVRDSILTASDELILERPVGSAVDRIDQLINWPPGEATSLHQPSNHRSVYLCMLRHDPPQELIAFDVPDGITDAGQRAETNSPAQSLFLLNNPFVVAQSRRLARKILTEHDHPRRCTDEAFRRILRREPTPQESIRAMSYLNSPDPARLASLCQALFATSEFRYVD